MPPTRQSSLEERVPAVLKRLAKAHEGAAMALDFTTPLECVVATILSAQSTDAKINEVTKHLFVKYRSPEDYLRVPDEELQNDIKSTGFFNQKTRSLKGMAGVLVEDFDGRVPETIAELITLPGVARKTANIVQANCYPEAAKKDPDAGIAVDTHVGRVAARLGWTAHDSKDAARIERDLMGAVPKKRWGTVTDLFIAHGRTICDAKRPRCEDCTVEPLCPSSQEAGLPDLYRRPRATMSGGASDRKRNAARPAL
ncbi:MAG: endonuclease III [Actinomycetota bacterium]|nr:endonuclease III [Actinomycetota bacterium]